MNFESICKEAIDLVSKNGVELENLSEEFRDDKNVVSADKEVVLAAVTQNGFALNYADESLKKDILKVAEIRLANKYV